MNVRLSEHEIFEIAEALEVSLKQSVSKITSSTISLSDSEKEFVSLIRKVVTLKNINLKFTEARKQIENEKNKEMQNL